MFKPYHYLLLFSCLVMSWLLWPHRLYIPPGFSLHGILQARTLEWVAISSSRGSLNPGLLCLLHWQADSLPWTTRKAFTFQLFIVIDNVKQIPLNVNLHCHSWLFLWNMFLELKLLSVWDSQYIVPNILLEEWC